MDVRRWVGVLVAAGLLQGFAPAPAVAEEGSTLQLWLHRRNPDEPFRFYGFFEAVSKYFRAHALGYGPDPLDVTTVIRTVDLSEQRDALRAEIEVLENKIGGAPLDVSERDRHLAQMRSAKAAIEAKLAETKARLESADAALEGGTIFESSRAWDQRMEHESALSKLKQRLARINDEITRTEAGKIKAMQTGELVDQLILKRQALKRVESGEEVVGLPVDLYLVSYKPLMLLTLGGILLLTALGVRLGRRSGNIAVGVVFSAAMAGLVYVFLVVIWAERLIPPTGVVTSPMAFGAGLVALIAARALAERMRRDVEPIWALKMALIAVAAVQLAIPLWHLTFGTTVLLGALLPIVFFGAWGFVAVAVLESSLHALLQVLVMAAVTLATVMVGDLSPWLGVGETLGALGVGLVLGMALVASDEARGRLTPVPGPKVEQAPAMEAMEEQETW